jgi:hypothetical protein
LDARIATALLRSAQRGQPQTLRRAWRLAAPSVAERPTALRSFDVDRRSQQEFEHGRHTPSSDRDPRISTCCWAAIGTTLNLILECRFSAAGRKTPARTQRNPRLKRGIRIQLPIAPKRSASSRYIRLVYDAIQRKGAIKSTSRVQRCFSSDPGLMRMPRQR